MAAEYTAGMESMWMDGASKGHVRIPYWLFVYYRQLGLSDQEYVLVCWISYHQRSAKPAFPHPAKTAQVLGITATEVVAMLHSLRDRGLMALEPTKNGQNYHQDLRPLRNALHELVSKASSIQLPDVKKDASIKTPGSIQVDASIPVTTPNRGGETRSLREMFREVQSRKKQANDDKPK